MKSWLVVSASLTLVACASGCASGGSSAVEVQQGTPSAAVDVPELEELPKVGAQPLPGQLVVHEWGTFTSRVAADGTLQTWRAEDRVEPLPKFVFESWTTPNKGTAEGTVRMETPVLYFYTDEPTHASATVTFAGGFLTEWYPSATLETTQEQASLSWPGFEILGVAGPDPVLPVDGDSHYYAARETDSAPLEVQGPGGIEHEKLLFYRGVGSFELPLVAARTNRTQISLAPAVELEGVIVFQRQGDKLGFEIVDRLDKPRSVAVPALDDELEQLTNELHGILVEQGLYEREATAMINTWQQLWFEDGLRVLYMVPRQFTDRTLELTIEPTPDELVRVLVGRLDLP